MPFVIYSVFYYLTGRMYKLTICLKSSTNCPIDDGLQVSEVHTKNRKYNWFPLLGSKSSHKNCSCRQVNCKHLPIDCDETHQTTFIDKNTRIES